MTSIRLTQRSVSKLITFCSILMIVTGILLLLPNTAFGHGYVEGPASRAALCKSGQNKDCGSIIYEPQSLEAPKGFPEKGPVDGKIASANGAFSKLDEQSATRWSKVNLSSGKNTFTWKISAAHATTSWKYYITKPNWNPNAPLTRDSFDLSPFCSVNYNGVQPPFSYTDTCYVPERSGYQVILAVWEIADTTNAFYNVIDVNFIGSNPVDTQAPTAPSTLTSTSKTTNTVSLNWKASSDNIGVTNYQIFNGSSFVANVSGSTLNTTLTGLTPNTAYTFNIKAVDAAGNVSVASNSVSVTTDAPPAIDTQAPTAPGGLHIMGVPTSSSLQLMWNKSTDDVGVIGYRIYNGKTLLTTISGTVTDYTVTGLSANTNYIFSVDALDTAGNQSIASTVNATTAAAPTTPTGSEWKANTHYAVGALVTYNGSTYSCRQAHTTLTGWEPPIVPALWLLK